MFVDSGPWQSLSATQRLPEANIVVSMYRYYGAFNNDFKADNIEWYFLRPSRLAVVYE